MNASQLVQQCQMEYDAAEDKYTRAQESMRDIIERCEREGRKDLTLEEDRQADEFYAEANLRRAEMKSLKLRLDNAKRVEAEEREFERPEPSRRSFAAAPRASGMQVRERSMADGTSRPASTTRSDDRPLFTRVSDGKDAALRSDMSFRDHELVRAEIERTADRDRYITGTHGDLGQLVRSISTSSGASAMVPTEWAAQVIDKARNAAVVMQAGATIVPMGSKVEQLARLTQDPAPVFRNEGNAIPATDPAFDNVTLTATSLGTIVVCSVELLQDAPNASEVVQNALAKAMALEIDKAALFGQLGATGTNDEGAAYGLASPYPKGLMKNLVDYNSGSQIVGSFPTNGTAQTAATPYLEMLAVLYKVLRSNENPSAIVSNTALVQQYDGMLDTMYNPVRKPDSLAKLPWMTTNSIPSYTRGTMSNRATDVFCGDWSQLLVGQRLGLQLRVLTERYAELGQVGLLAFWRGDVAVARPTAFAAYRGLQGAV